MRPPAPYYNKYNIGTGMAQAFLPWTAAQFSNIAATGLPWITSAAEGAASTAAALPTYIAQAGLPFISPAAASAGAGTAGGAAAAGGLAEAGGAAAAGAGGLAEAGGAAAAGVGGAAGGGGALAAAGPVGLALAAAGLGYLGNGYLQEKGALDGVLGKDKDGKSYSLVGGIEHVFADGVYGNTHDAVKDAVGGGVMGEIAGSAAGAGTTTLAALAALPALPIATSAAIWSGVASVGESIWDHFSK